MPLCPLLDLRPPSPRITGKFDYVVLGERHIDGGGDGFAGNTPAWIAGVLPQALDPQVAVEGAAHQRGGVTGCGTVERQHHPFTRIDGTLDPAGIPGAPRQPRLHAGNPLAQAKLPEHGFPDGLTGSLQAVLAQERVTAG